MLYSPLLANVSVRHTTINDALMLDPDQLLMSPTDEKFWLF